MHFLTLGPSWNGQPADLACRPLGRNKFFRGDPNISEKFVPGGTNLRGVQIKRDSYTNSTNQGAVVSLPW